MFFHNATDRTGEGVQQLYMKKGMWLPVTPIGKPRMTQRDVWKKRPCILRYHAFRDALKPYREFFAHNDQLYMEFHIPMPKTWSKKKKLEMIRQGHQSRPDIDNLVKGVLDSLKDEDKSIFHIVAKKFWNDKGSIYIEGIYD